MSVINDVIVKSTIKAVVVINVPSLNLKRTWQKKGAIQRIPMMLLEQAIYDPGVEYLFKSGILYIDDMNTKIALGLEEPETTQPTKIILLDNKMAKELLVNTPLKDFREKIELLSHDQLIELANIAIELGITDYHRIKILKDKTNIDVLNFVMENEKEKEQEVK